MQITNSFSLNVKDYCEYCPDFSPCAETLDITTIADLPNRKAIHVIGCMDAERCEKIRERMKAEMEAQREEAEKVQCNVRGCENERSENGADSDNERLTAAKLAYQTFGRKKIKVVSAKVVKEDGKTD